MICALTGMEVANASHYDGATSAAEAVIMAVNAGRGRRKRVILSPAIHPSYRAVVRTYTQGMETEIVGDQDPTATVDDLTALLDKNTACLMVQSPNFFGEMEDLEGLAEKVHSVRAMLIVVADPISLGMLRPPGDYGADIVVGEGQALGNGLNFGGPYLGYFACRQKDVRKMAGRLVGQTLDAEGRRGFVLTLATREQHIRRARATSNICTNQALCALATAVHLTALGRSGLRKLAELCYHKAHYAAVRIDELDGYRLVTEKPFFKEFVIHCPAPVQAVNDHLMEESAMVGGYDLGRDYAHRENHMLLCVTEVICREEIDALVEALAKAAKEVAA
jgi:glycine dehydrogenase subunit 1